MKGKATSIKILLADDHPLIRLGILTELKKNKNFRVIGEASNGEDVITMANELKPDLILLDIAMPGLNGLEVMAKLTEISCKSKVIALTMHDNINYMKEMQRLGANGFVLKDCAPAELEEAIYSVISSSSFYYSYKKYLSNLKKNGQGENLTSRELEVLRLIAAGMTNKQMAEKLFISKRTVEAHRDRIKKKLNLSNSAQLTRYVIDSGIS